MKKVDTVYNIVDIVFVGSWLCRSVRMHSFASGVLSVIMGCAAARPYLNSDHFDGNRFHNSPPTKHLSFIAVAKHVISGRSNEWPQTIRKPLAMPMPRLDRGAISVTFVNHATMLLRSHDFAVLTDPVWAERVGPFSWAGPKRAVEPGVAFSDLPRIDAVVISHNHYDHMDLPTLRRLKEHSNPVFVVPLGIAEFIHDNVSANVLELDWWASHRFDGKCTIVMTPSRHNSGRGLFDRDKSLWASYAIFLNDRDYVYFAGDTAYGNHFSEISRRLGNPAIALLPIGAYEPHERMGESHVNPAEALQAHLDMKARISIAMHFGTFNLTAEAIDRPMEDLREAIERKKIKNPGFLVLTESQTYVANRTLREITK